MTSGEVETLEYTQALLLLRAAADALASGEINIGERYAHARALATAAIELLR